MIGVNDAKAINPKPSSKGLRPLILDAKPTPKAVVNGTVIVEVVTPPESYATAMMDWGANGVINITTA